MSWLITVVMLITLNAEGEAINAVPVMEYNRTAVEKYEVCEDVAEANNGEYPIIYSTDGTQYMTAFNYCERSL